MRDLEILLSSCNSSSVRNIGLLFDFLVMIPPFEVLARIITNTSCIVGILMKPYTSLEV